MENDARMRGGNVKRRDHRRGNNILKGATVVKGTLYNPLMLTSRVAGKRNLKDINVRKITTFFLLKLKTIKET